MVVVGYVRRQTVDFEAIHLLFLKILFHKPAALSIKKHNAQRKLDLSNLTSQGLVETKHSGKKRNKNAITKGACAKKCWFDSVLESFF